MLDSKILRISAIALVVCILLLLPACTEEKDQRPGGVCLSFDDRTIAEWYSMRPIFSKYHAKVTFFVTQFDSLSENEIWMLQELRADGHEIGSHGALHVRSEHYIKEHGYNDYIRNEVDASIVSMTEKDLKPTSFAYPYGAKYWFTDFLLGRKFKVLRGVAILRETSRINELDDIYYDFDGRTTIDALSIDMNSNVNEDAIISALTRASDKREIISLYAHTPMTGNSGNGNPYEFDIRLLEFLLREAEKQKLKFYRMSELVD